LQDCSAIVIQLIRDRRLHMATSTHKRQTNLSHLLAGEARRLGLPLGAGIVAASGLSPVVLASALLDRADPIFCTNLPVGSARGESGLTYGSALDTAEDDVALGASWYPDSGYNALAELAIVNLRDTLFALPVQNNPFDTHPESQTAECKAAHIESSLLLLSSDRPSFLPCRLRG
jgi:hypothetical protein